MREMRNSMAVARKNLAEIWRHVENWVTVQHSILTAQHSARTAHVPQIV
jgi:hypothetical protein